MMSDFDVGDDMPLNMTASDLELLNQYARKTSEDAFAALVHRHIAPLPTRLRRAALMNTKSSPSSRCLVNKEISLSHTLDSAHAFLNNFCSVSFLSGSLLVN